MTRSRLVLLDANVVIELHCIRLWAAVCAQYQIALTEAVRDESKYFDCGDGTQERINLGADIEAGTIELIEVGTREFAQFQAQFDPGYVERLDDGECESLAYLTGSRDVAEGLICSADAIVWRVLGNLHLRERGISLEEMLAPGGSTGSLSHQYSRSFREHWTSKGFAEGFQGIGRL